MPPLSELDRWTDPGQPGWWIDQLEKRLQAVRAEMDYHQRFYAGDHPLPFLSTTHRSKIHSEFRRMLEESRLNLCETVVDAKLERLRVDGIRLSSQSEPVADEESWRIWQANQMDMHFPMAMQEALVKRRCYLSVWNTGEFPSIAVEDPTQTVVAHRTQDNGHRVRAAGLKMWSDEWTGQEQATLYMPDAVYKLTRKRRRGPWEKRSDDGWIVDNPVGEVPLVPVLNNPGLDLEGRSELASDATALQNQLNSLLFLLMLAGYFGAHRQRWATGVKIARDDEGKPIEPFDAAIDKLWTADSAPGASEVKFGEFEQTDLDGYIESIEQKVNHFAEQHGLPRHYRIQQGQSPSGDAIRSAESRLIRIVQSKQAPFGEAAEEAIRLARRFAGAAEMPADAEIVWQDPATPTVAELTDAVIKQFQAGLIPWEAALEKLNYTGAQIARYRRMRDEDVFAQAVVEEPEAPTVPVVE